MFCGECGTNNPDTNRFCKNCGNPLKKAPVAEQPVPAPSPAPTVSSQPAADSTYPSAPSEVMPSTPFPTMQPQGASVTEQKSKKNWLAIACLGLSLISWIIYPYIFAILAVLTGAGAISTGRKQAGKVPLLAVIGILIALGSIVLNFSYLDLFAPQLLPPHS